MYLYSLYFSSMGEEGVVKSDLILGAEREHRVAEAGVMTTHLPFSTYVSNFYHHLLMLHQ